MNPDDRLTVREVAAMLRESEQTTRNRMGNEIPAAKVGGYRWLATRADVTAYMDANTVTDRSSKARKRGRGRRAA